jgi:hypothetical protein
VILYDPLIPRSHLGDGDSQAPPVELRQERAFLGYATTVERGAVLVRAERDVGIVGV